eukprot:271983_1
MAQEKKEMDEKEKEKLQKKIDATYREADSKFLLYLENNDVEHVNVIYALVNNDINSEKAMSKMEKSKWNSIENDFNSAQESISNQASINRANDDLANMKKLANM